MARPGDPPRRMAESPTGAVFQPKPRNLVDHYLVPRALHGRVSGDAIQGAVAEGVDVYATRPEALPFPPSHRGKYGGDGSVWGYFFTARPAAAAAGGPRGNARDVAGGGCWVWCGGRDKEYAGDDGDVYAFRARFAYYEDGGKLTPWRMMEYRLNEGAARFRGVAFHPSANNLVVWQVYYKVEIAGEKPPMGYYYNSNDGDENEVKEPTTAIHPTIGSSMAQPPQSATTHAPAPGKRRLCLAELPPGYVFQPNPRELVDCYLIPQALRGRVLDNVIQDGVVDGVNVHAARPEALPFPSCNRKVCHRDGDHTVWGYFFTTRPGDAAAGGSGKYVREVAAGGRWCWCCGPDKGYAGDDGEVYAFRTRFAYYEDGGKLTPWRAKEYRLNEGAACFRGVAFHPGANNLVVWKVYCIVVIPKEEPPIEYYDSSDDGEEEPRRKRIKTG